MIIIQLWWNLKNKQFSFFKNLQDFHKIPADTFFHATDLVEKLISQKKKVVRYPLVGYWIDIGNSDEYYKACEMAKHI